MFSRLPRFSPLSTNAACGKARAHSLFVLIVSFTPRALAVPGVSLLLYGKSQPRPGRKMGHLTALADTVEAAIANVTRARSLACGEKSSALS